MIRPSLVLLVTLALGCAGVQRIDPARQPIVLTYLGVAGWSLSDGKTTILVDPFFSRGPLPAGTDRLVPDEKQIARHAPAHADLILVGHSHFDHLLDVPAIAARTGAQILGSQSSTNYARASGIPGDHLITVKGGEDYEFGAFSVRVIPGLHSALDDKHGYAAIQSIPADIKLPLTFDEFDQGGTLAYLVRIAGHEILFIDSANYIEREMEGLRPDVAIVATGLREEIHDYSCRLMHALGQPPLVITNHFDAWTKPVDDDLNPSKESSADLDAFSGEVRGCSPSTRVVIPEHGKPITVP